jgi:hypothetical protein
VLPNVSKACSASEMRENINTATEYHIPEEMNPYSILLYNQSLLHFHAKRLSRISNTFLKVLALGGVVFKALRY